MNATQTKYATERARIAMKRREEAVNKAFSGRKVHLDDAAVRAALRKGEFVVTKPDSDPRSRYSYLSSYVTFKAEAGNEKVEAEKQAALQALKSEHEALMDRLMLGGADEALALLQAFEAA